MPKNNNVKAVPLPMVQRWGEKPKTEFKNNLDAIKVTLINAPSMDDLRGYIARFLDATWAEHPEQADIMCKQERDDLLIECIKGRALPTALETIGLVWQIDGISLQEVTHILRYRGASFSADCSADKWWTNKAALVPNSIQQSNGSNTSWDASVDGVRDHADFYSRYQKIVQDAKELYCDMIDSKEVSILDARYILPRCLETFYFMRMNLNDTLHFIKQRIDKQIQPETDNLIAYQMYYELLKQYPIMTGIIDIHAPAAFYIKMHDSGRTSNIYFPDEDSDKFDWNENSFIYQKRRDELNGTDEDATNLFNAYIIHYDKLISRQERINKYKLLEEYAGIIF